MQYDFDIIRNRKNTASLKWDDMHILLPHYHADEFDDMLPLWVADMDFKAPQTLLDALMKTAIHGIYGYTNVPRTHADLVQQWLKKVHNWHISSDGIFFAGGVIYALLSTILALTDEGDEVMYFSPIYAPIKNAIIDHNRVPNIYTPVLNETQFEIDFDALQKQITKKTKLLILCNPHNPSGRLWTKDELLRIAEICLLNNIIICSNDIHADITYTDYTYTPIASLGKEILNNTITYMSPSKTFNLGGQKIAHTYIPNPTIYKQVSDKHTAIWGNQPFTNFGVSAFQSVYEEGYEWYKALMEYLQKNRDYCMHFIDEHLPMINPILPQATYLLWMDCTGMSNDENQIVDFFARKAKVLLSQGSFFGKEGLGFMRLNFACPHSILKEALERIKNTT